MRSPENSTRRAPTQEASNDPSAFVQGLRPIAGAALASNTTPYAGYHRRFITRQTVVYAST